LADYSWVSLAIAAVWKVAVEYDEKEAVGGSRLWQVY
jgi:hypothetical protein